MNGVFLKKTSRAACWICGSVSVLTREHKFKASDIRKIYEKETLFIHRGELGSGDVRQVQGIKSKSFKFESFICETCNSNTTQKSDFAYDIVADMALQPESIESRIISIENSSNLEWIEINRFFSKQFGCRLAEIDAPIPRRLSNFVARKSNRPCLRIEIRQDPGYSELKGTEIEDLIPCLSHDGIIFIYTEQKNLISKARSSYSINGIQFLFEILFSLIESIEIRYIHAEFARNLVNKVTRNPDDISANRALERLGFKD